MTRDIKKYGAGYIRVRKELAAYPTMSFDYEESGDGYFVSVNYREQKTVTTPKTTPKTRERLIELTGRNSRVTREELAQQLGISINGVKQHILKLKKEGCSGKNRWQSSRIMANHNRQELVLVAGASGAVKESERIRVKP